MLLARKRLMGSWSSTRVGMLHVSPRSWRDDEGDEDRPEAVAAPRPVDDVAEEVEELTLRPNDDLVADRLLVRAGLVDLAGPATHESPPSVVRVK